MMGALNSASLIFKYTAGQVRREEPSSFPGAFAFTSRGGSKGVCEEAHSSRHKNSDCEVQNYSKESSGSGNQTRSDVLIDWGDDEKKRKVLNKGRNQTIAQRCLWSARSGHVEEPTRAMPRFLWLSPGALLRSLRSHSHKPGGRRWFLTNYLCVCLSVCLCI